MTNHEIFTCSRPVHTKRCYWWYFWNGLSSESFKAIKALYALKAMKALYALCAKYTNVFVEKRTLIEKRKI